MAEICAAYQSATKQNGRKKILCPNCGSSQNVFYDPDAVCKGIYLKCKARHCGRIFEIVIEDIPQDTEK